MKTLISNMIKYVLKNYPHKSDLSASRLTKIIYLADWKSAIEKDEQLTNVSWVFNHYGPYVPDFLKIAAEDSDIIVKVMPNIHGKMKQQIELAEHFDASKEIEITDFQKEVLDFVINATKNKNYLDFIKLVYSTYPVMTSERYDILDLSQKAKEYKAIW